MIAMKRFAVLAFTASVGCSASLDDIRRAETNPEFCRQNSSLREQPRNAHIVFDEMQAHRRQITEITLLGGPAGFRIPRARALIQPGLAAGSNFDSSRCDLTGAVGSDGSRRLNMSFDIPDFVPPDGAANDTMGGPYVVQFWSDNDGSGGLSSDIGHLDTADHLWVRPMCDDGAIYFVHASGIDTPEGFANAERFRQGRFRFDITAAAITQLESRMPTGQSGLIRSAPMVVEANWQGQTVAYVRTVLRCDNEGAAGYELRNVIDPGSAHAIRTYWDIGRDGAFTEACDPVCLKTQEAIQSIEVSPTLRVPALHVEMDDALTGWSCTVPRDFAACMVAPDR